MNIIKHVIIRDECLLSISTNTDLSPQDTKFWNAFSIITLINSVITFFRETTYRLKGTGSKTYRCITGYRLHLDRRMVSSGLLRRVALVKTDISEEPGASFIRVTKICELGTTQAATSNRRTLRKNFFAAYVGSYKSHTA
jgi:hypothetical protein